MILKIDFFHKKVKALKPFGFFDYNNLQKNSFVVISDSGTLSEESSILQFPGVLIRTSTERPEVLDKGTIVVGGIKSSDIISSIELVVDDRETLLADHRPKDYMDTNISTKVVKIIQSYSKIIKRTVWNQEI